MKNTDNHPEVLVPSHEVLVHQTVQEVLGLDKAVNRLKNKGDLPATSVIDLDHMPRIIPGMSQQDRESVIGEVDEVLTDVLRNPEVQTMIYPHLEPKEIHWQDRYDNPLDTEFTGLTEHLSLAKHTYLSDKGRPLQVGVQIWVTDIPIDLVLQQDSQTAVEA